MRHRLADPSIPLRASASRVLAGCVALVAAACIDLKPAEPPLVRHLTLAPPSATSGARATSPNDPLLRIGRVDVAESIRDRLIRRVSAYEVRYDDFARWAEPLERTLERDLDAILFQTGTYTPDDAAPRRLDVELVAFEEQVTPRRAGVVALLVRLTGPDGQRLIDRRIEASQVIVGDDPAVAAEALSAALHAAIRQLSDLIALK